MGQHKYNPNCQLAKEGKLPPKPKRMSKRESEMLMYAKVQEVVLKRVFGFFDRERKENETD